MTTSSWLLLAVVLAAGCARVGTPAGALALADEGEQRFGDSPSAEERRALAISALVNLERIGSLLVDALINQQRIGAARDETYYYLGHHPRGRFTEHLFIMTGVHPTPRRPPG